MESRTIGLRLMSYPLCLFPAYSVTQVRFGDDIINYDLKGQNYFAIQQVRSFDCCVAEVILVNKEILKRMPAHKIIEVLKERVFPYVTDGELIKVDFKVTVDCDHIEVGME